MNIKPVLCALCASFLLTSCGTQLNSGYLLSGGQKLAQAATLTDEQMAAYVGQTIAKLDSENIVLPESDEYVKRVRRITQGLTEVDGTPLNFQVYKTDDVNAFACADGSVRIYSGLLDVMNDDETLGVIGHEIGHVAMKHSRKQFQRALMTSALRDAVISTGGKVAVLTSSQLGDLGEVLMSKNYSRQQEYEADDFGYAFLKAAGKNPWAMAMAFEELERLSSGQTDGAGQSAIGAKINNAFSDHPATSERIARMSERATADGFKRPSE
ncbi:MAG: M48 family metallopeptidase [Candidatus Cryptobacteroides sp.]